MGNMKRVMALMLVVAMSLCFAVSASAAESPTKDSGNAPVAQLPAPAPAPRTIDDTTSIGNLIHFTVANDIETVTLVQATQVTTTCYVPSGAITGTSGKTTIIGNGTDGVWDNKYGQSTVGVVIDDPAGLTIVNTNAFKGAQVQNMTVKSETEFRANAFAGTNKKTVTITLAGNARVKAVKGAFKALSKKSLIRVSKKTMTKKQFKKLKKKLMKWGFKGKFKRF